MAESHHSYQVPSRAADSTPQTEAERQAQHDAARQPGRVKYQTGTGEVTIEQVESSPVVTPAEKASDWLNSMTDASGKLVDYFDRGSLKDSDIFVQVGQDRMTMAAAKAAGLIKRDASGRLINTAAPSVNPNTPAEASADANKSQQEQNKAGDEPVRWESEVVDQVMSTIGQKLGEQTLAGLVSIGISGATELSDAKARALSQILDGVEPAEIQASYRAAVAATVEQANSLVQQAGVQDLDAFYGFMEQNRSGDLAEIRYSFAEGNAAPLVKAAKEYLASHPDAGVDRDTLEHLLDTEPQGDGKKHVVTGGKLFRNEKGTPMCEINGAVMTLAAARRAGYVKVSINE